MKHIIKKVIKAEKPIDREQTQTNDQFFAKLRREIESK